MAAVILVEQKRVWWNEQVEKEAVILTKTAKEGRVRALIGRCKKQPITHAVIVVSVVWTAVVLTAPTNDWRSRGVSDGFRVFGGDYWSLFTSVFAHGSLPHIIFNVYWLAILGGYVEEHFGKRFYGIFLAIASFCSSTLELSISGETGIGISGVAYGIFGFLWGTKLIAKQEHPVLAGNTIPTFLVWLFLCVLLSASDIMAIGNVAHFTGLVVGLLAALACLKQRFLTQSLLPALVVICTILLFYSPWSESWLSWKAYKAELDGAYESSENYYTRLLRKDPDNVWALESRAEVRQQLGQSSAAEEDRRRAKQFKGK